MNEIECLGGMKTNVTDTHTCVQVRKHKGRVIGLSEAVQMFTQCVKRKIILCPDGAFL